MANILIGTTLGLVAGLLLRPILDAYLLARTIDWFHRSRAQHDPAPDEVDVDHASGR